MHITHLEIFLRVFVALACGALLGGEREYRGRDAGLKTHAGLAVACCLAIIVSAFGFSEAVTQGLIALDPSRIAAGVEGGIGFACASVIWRSRNKVIGLTSAINIWATANVGMACGAGMYFAALLITGVMLFIHIGLGSIERRWFPRHNACTLSVKVKTGVVGLSERIGLLVSSSSAELLSINTINSEDGLGIVELEIGRCQIASYLRLVASLQAMEGVSAVTCTGMCTVD